MPDGSKEKIEINKNVNVVNEIDKFFKLFKCKKNDKKFINNGVFGYMNYDSVKHFEDIDLNSKENDIEIP